MAESRFKIFSDPVHGFISVPKNLILNLIQTPQVQRLRRIRQLGVGHLVFPGAEHTRFGHALGAMALMHDALTSLSEKGTLITPDEYTAAMAAALLHDIGHGPFSHTLEHELIVDFHHEAMSRALLTVLNRTFDGALDLAIQIFDNTYERPFFHQLVSSQLDMDRLDYLRRDSFYTGVVEGRVGVERIIKTLRVHPTAGGPNAEVVIESKGIYAAENFILARRLMYWQVYLHKTVLAGDQLLRSIFHRVRQHLHRDGLDVASSAALLFFLRQRIHRQEITRPDVLEAFCALDDTDVIFSMKQWMTSSDPILADLSRRFINRDFFRVAFLAEPASEEQLQDWRGCIAAWLVQQHLSRPDQADADADHYLILDRSHHAAYERADAGLRVLERDGQVRELSESTDTSAIATQTRSVIKPYVCYPKEVALRDALTPNPSHL